MSGNENKQNAQTTTKDQVDQEHSSNDGQEHNQDAVDGDQGHDHQEDQHQEELVADPPNSQDQQDAEQQEDAQPIADLMQEYQPEDSQRAVQRSNENHELIDTRADVHGTLGSNNDSERSLRQNVFMNIRHHHGLHVGGLQVPLSEEGDAAPPEQAENDQQPPRRLKVLRTKCTKSEEDARKGDVVRDADILRVRIRGKNEDGAPQERQQEVAGRDVAEAGVRFDHHPDAPNVDRGGDDDRGEVRVEGRAAEGHSDPSSQENVSQNRLPPPDAQQQAVVRRPPVLAPTGVRSLDGVRAPDSSNSAPNYLSDSQKVDPNYQINPSMNSDLRSNNTGGVRRPPSTNEDWREPVKALQIAFSELKQQIEERVLQLTEQVVGVTEQVVRVTEQVDGLAEQVVGVIERVDGVIERVDGLAERVDGLSGQVNVLSDQVDNMNRNVTETNRLLRELRDSRNEDRNSENQNEKKIKKRNAKEFGQNIDNENTNLRKPNKDGDDEFDHQELSRPCIKCHIF